MTIPTILNTTTAILALAAGVALSPALAHAQADTFPTRPIRFIVPFAPAGVSDIVARTIGARLQETLGQPVMFDNRGGAGGTIGTDILARANPDGHTISIGNLSTHTIAPSVYSSLADSAPSPSASSSAEK